MFCYIWTMANIHRIAPRLVVHADLDGEAVGRGVGSKEKLAERYEGNVDGGGRGVSGKAAATVGRALGMTTGKNRWGRTVIKREDQRESILQLCIDYF